MTLCPGKCSASLYGYTWQRDLDGDMQKVMDWGADTVVTLMETDELQSCNALAIKDVCAKADIEWHHLPIRDVDIPDNQFEQIWTYSGTRLRLTLNKGKRVLLHCLGGLGRTGTIAARLLVELGWDNETAIDTVRKSRPGAIQTFAQEEYARNCHSLKEHNYERISQLMGCVFGGAIGDGLGFLVEFDSINDIRKIYGHKGVTIPVRDDKITVSDDTQMTLFTLEGLLRAQGLSPDMMVEEVRNAYLDWICTQSDRLANDKIFGRLAHSSALQVRRAPGNTCLGALDAGGNGTPYKPINGSKGCGAVMRVAPAGFFFSNLNELQIFELGMRTGALTHGHMTSSLSSGAMALMISGLMRGETLHTVASSTLMMLREYPDHEETSLAITKALESAESNTGNHPEAINALWGDKRLKDNNSRGWVAEEALAIGLYSALQGHDYSEVIQIAANHNGDSDSTASIAGQLYGAWMGVDVVPHKWITKLDVFQEAITLITATVQFL